MKRTIDVRLLPERYRAPVRDMCRKILGAYPNTAAFAVIGSVADGSCDTDSDVDLVWLLRGRRRRRWYEELGYSCEGTVELVPLNVSELRRQFAQCSPLAQSIQHSIVLYDPQGQIRRLPRKALGPPTREWMEEWFAFFWQRFDWGLDSYRREQKHHRRFCRDQCICHVTEILTRAVVNLVRILLATEGLVSKSKAEMREQYPAVLRGPRLRRAMEVALAAHHEKRDPSLSEAEEMVYLGRWARTRLVAFLGEPQIAGRLP